VKGRWGTRPSHFDALSLFWSEANFSSWRIAAL